VKEILASGFSFGTLAYYPNCSQEISSLYSKILELSRARYRDINSSVVSDLAQRVRRRNRTADVYSYVLQQDAQSLPPDARSW